MVKQKTEEEDLSEQMKWEIARELGLAEKVTRLGWGGLSAAETGRIGGLMTRRLRKTGSPEPSNGKPDSGDKSRDPGGDRFIDGKIGSGYIVTVGDHPDLDDYAKESRPGTRT